MPAKPTGNSEPWGRAIDDYAEQSRRPLAALAFVLPLLALYEAGVLLLGPQAVRNGADVWLRQSLDLLGFGQYFLLPIMTIGMLLAWHHVAQDRWQVSVVVLYVMFAECALLGLGLVGVGRLQAVVMHNWQAGDGAFVAAMPWTFAGRSAFVGRLLGFVGAGVYEETLFRLMLLPPVSVCAERLGARRWLGTACAVLLTSLLFAAAHYVGPHGEAFDAFSFSFRCIAGAFFALLFVCRGFGIAAGTHAMYDIFVGLG